MSQKGHPAQGTRILMIDDDVGLLTRSTHFLRAKGFEVRGTSNVFEIPSLVNEFRPSVVVLDVNMPAVSGQGVATTLQRMCDVPIVFYSAVADDEGRALAAQHAGTRFVSKALGLRVLEEALVNVLSKQRNGAHVVDGASGS